jgi:hypothetical protein
MAEDFDRLDKIVADREPTWYTMIPNMIDEMGLSVYAYRLYGRLKRICGEQADNTSWQSTATLMEACKMSRGSVTNAKKELVRHNLITIQHGDYKKSESDTIRIVNIWDDNYRIYREKYPNGK